MPGCLSAAGAMRNGFEPRRTLSRASSEFANLMLRPRLFVHEGRRLP
jgi:hypothetical protein